jgi:hypothetical protein
MAYDARAVNIPKSVKRMAAAYIDHHQRRGFIKSYVKILEGEARQKSSRRDSKSNNDK